MSQSKMTVATLSKPFQAASEPPRARTKAKSKHPPPFSIRFTDEERARLNRDAGALSLAAYVRLKLFAGDEPPPTKRKPTRKKYQPSAELAVLGHMLGGLRQSRLAETPAGGSGRMR